MSGWRQVGAALLVAVAAGAALWEVPLFFPSAARWPAVAIIVVLAGAALAGIASRQVPRFDLPAKTAGASVTSFLAGLGLFIAFAAIATNSYDERPRPWWLVALWILAVALIGTGVVGVLVSAAGRVGSRRGHRRVRRHSL
jgi:FtsH-binding integral membrane protein